MMNELQIFNNNEFGEVRSLVINDVPWFVGKDICQVFGDKNHNRSISRVADEDKREEEIIDTLGRKQTAIFINESGLYSLLFAMQPQKANNGGVSDAYPIEVSNRIEKLHRFKRWVTSEVLPSIRKHGLYAMDELLENPDIAINALLKLKEEKEKRKALEIENKVKDQQIAELKPKATYYDLILQCKDLISMTEIAKDYGMSAKGMNAKLHELGVQFKQSGVWFLYAKYQDKGYTQTKTQNYNKPDGTQGVATHMYWTQKGRLFLYALLKESGILPMIERNMEVA